MLDDHELACELAAEAGRRLVGLRAGGGDPDVLRKADDRTSEAAMEDRKREGYF